MATFTAIPHFGDEQGDTIALEAADPAEAVKVARGHLQAVLDESPDIDRASICIGQGEGTDVDWIGAWDWDEERQSWLWTVDS